MFNLYITRPYDIYNLLSRSYTLYSLLHTHMMKKRDAERERERASERDREGRWRMIVLSVMYIFKVHTYEHTNTVHITR